MDALTARAAPPLADAYLPPPAPLGMPAQSLSATVERHPAPPTAPRFIAARRTFLLGATLALTMLAAHEMYLTLGIGGLTVLETLVLGLYVTLFAWVAFSFASAVGGLISLLGRRPVLDIDVAGPLPPLSRRTALLVPTYNEAPHRVMSRVAAIDESLRETGAPNHFDIFLLSDTTDPDLWIAEEAAFLRLRDRNDAAGRLFYRRRPSNTERKAGNIADWVRRFGAAYDHMLILDADSLMTGEAIVRLAAAMERHPRVALIQTHPVIVNAGTVFARLQQFAGRLYGPVIAAGVAWWQGADGNYWGHNAIIRIEAFAACAGLPCLRGPRPIGGHILSHDFVEAALLRRQGWAVHMAAHLPGSYEECPPSITDYAARDRRWCQGNLQHIGVLPARGLHWVSRLHFAIGIGSYLAAPLWLAFLWVGILISLQALFIRPEYFPQGYSLFPQWPAQDPVRAAWVFAGTMALLLMPKLFGYLCALPVQATRRGFGGGVRTFFGLIFEIIVSGLIAPIMMLVQSAGVLGIVLGRDVGWNAQRRDDGTLSRQDLLRRYGGYTLFGILTGVGAYLVAPSLFLWMLPVIVGLALAIPLAAWTACPRAGAALRRSGLLQVPEETAPPAVLLRANQLAEAAEAEEIDAVGRLAHDPALLAAHKAMLPAPSPRPPGAVDAISVVARAKLDACETWRQAATVLSRAELLALLGEPASVDRLVRLKRREGTA